MKRMISLLVVVVLVGVIYYLLGKIGIVPLYHCDSSMGPNGIISWCEWYRGAERIY